MEKDETIIDNRNEVKQLKFPSILHKHFMKVKRNENTI